MGAPVGQGHVAGDSVRPSERFAVPIVLRKPLGMVALIGALVVAVPAVVFAGETAPGDLDRRIESILDNPPPASRAAALVVDWLGEPAGLALSISVIAALCVICGQYRLAVLAVAGTLLVGATTTLLKPVIDRRIYGEFQSYPSGHTAVLVALGFVVALLMVNQLRTRQVAGLLLIVIGTAIIAGTGMAWAQVALGAHYPTDTLGGFGAALAVMPVVAWLIDWAAARILVGR